MTIKFERGKKGTLEWEHMLTHNKKACLGLHYIGKEWKANEKKIIAKYLELAAKEISDMRNAKP